MLKGVRFLGLVLLCVLLGGMFYVDGATLDELRGGNSGTVVGDTNKDAGITDYLRNYKGVTQKDMERANRYAGPLASVIGTANGFVLLLSWVAVTFFSALDLFYLVVPPVRDTLNPPMGGRRWVSDEAISVLMEAGMAQGGGMAQGMPQGAGGMNPMMGGMYPGRSGGRFGRNPMMTGMAGNMMGGMPQADIRPGLNILVLSYAKKRIIMVIVFFAASVILTSSVLVGAGLNIAEAIIRIFGVGLDSIRTFQ